MPAPQSPTPAAPPAATPTQQAPAWVRGASPRTAYWRGLRVAGTTPGLVLLATSLGFGALARDAGFQLGHALFLSSFLYALPAQVILVDQLARGASLLAAAFAVSLTAIRLLPMTVNLIPYFRADPGPLWMRLVAVHFIAITAWIEGNRRLPALPSHLRLPHFLGIGSGTIAMTVLGTLIGYQVAGAVPPAVAAALLMMTPLYFALSLLGGVRERIDSLAIGLGAVLGPVSYVLVPGFDLLIAGVVGGTIACLLAPQRKTAAATGPGDRAR